MDPKPKRHLNHLKTEVLELENVLEQLKTPACRNLIGADNASRAIIIVSCERDSIVKEIKQLEHYCRVWFPDTYNTFDDVVKEISGDDTPNSPTN